MTDLRAAAEMSLDVLTAHYQSKDEADVKRAKVITALRQALAQPEHEPVAWISDSPTKGNGKQLYWTMEQAWKLSSNITPLYTSPPNKQKQEPVTLESVYETIIHWDEGGGKRSRRELARRIVARYAAPLSKPEPVAWMYVNEDGECEQIEYGVSTVEAPYITLLYTAPPSKPWVSLTDEAIDRYRSGYQSGRIGTFVELARAIEAKLKEKNNG